MVLKLIQFGLQASLVPSGITGWPKKDRAAIVVHTMNLPAIRTEVDTYLRADKSG
jgi:hypothetical protein